MRKYLLVTLVMIGLVAGLYVAGLNRGVWLPKPTLMLQKQAKDVSISIDEALRLLKIRQDKDAGEIFERILARQPDNLDALWGKAEILRRRRKYKEAESLFNEILNIDTSHAPSLISLSYIKYKDDKLTQAQELLDRVLEIDTLDNENRALLYVMLGTINTKRCKKSNFIDKIRYGVKIKYYFLKAKLLAPDLAEVHFSLGTFYLTAPSIMGGSLKKAIEELKLAVEIAPDFATACARLAQAYKKEGDLEKYNFYLHRVKILDPENEVLKEMD
jgi:tetratricopeptide (TPR) repeat protein